MLKKDTLKNGTSRIGVYGSASPLGSTSIMSGNGKEFTLEELLKSPFTEL